MKVITARDLYDIEYKRLKNNVIGCKYPMTSTLGFPNIKEFPKSWIKLWDSIITSLILPRLKCLPPTQKVSISHLDNDTETKTECSENPFTTVNLSHDDIKINSSKFKKAVECIHNNMRRSEPWKRHIWGKSILSPKALHDVITLATAKNLIIATDASVDQGYAAHVFCFAKKKNGRVLSSTGSKVEGPKNHLTSYRAEMTSIIAAVELFALIMRSVGISKTRAPLYTDSETSIISSKNKKTQHAALHTFERH